MPGRQTVLKGEVFRMLRQDGSVFPAKLPAHRRTICPCWITHRQHLWGQQNRQEALFVFGTILAVTQIISREIDFPKAGCCRRHRQQNIFDHIPKLSPGNSAAVVFCEQNDRRQFSTHGFQVRAHGQLTDAFAHRLPHPNRVSIVNSAVDPGECHFVCPLADA